MTVSPRRIDSISRSPERAKTAVTTPVWTVTCCRSVVTVSGAGGFAAGPAASRYVAARGPALLVACAVHLTEPSGHQPIGHDCTGTGVPSPVVSANSCPGANAPRGHGTPHVVPPASSTGAPPSSQRRATGSWPVRFAGTG